MIWLFSKHSNAWMSIFINSVALWIPQSLKKNTARWANSSEVQITSCKVMENETKKIESDGILDWV